MQVEFYTDEYGEPRLRSESWVLDEVLFYERRELPAVLDAVRAIESGRSRKWQAGFDAGGFILTETGATVYSDYTRGPEGQFELGLAELADIIERYLAYRVRRPK